MARSPLTQERLKELFEYNPDSGEFKRKVTVVHNAKKGDIAGYKDVSGYLQIRVDDKLYFAHRLAFMYMIGRWPDQTDHINHVRDDNRWENLREATVHENNKNYTMRSDNKSGITGVCWNTKRKKWHAQIQVDKKNKNIGLFDDFFEACCARKSAEVKYGFHPNHGRNI